MPKQPTSGSSQRHNDAPGTSVPFDSINSPGAYVMDGNLLRVTSESLSPSCSPTLSITSRNPLRVTKISDDPFVPIQQAARIAADHNIAQQFA